MRALLLPPDPKEEGTEGGGARLPEECTALVWRCLALVERMCFSSLSRESRRAAPPVVRLVATAQRLSRALVAPIPGPRIREVRGLAELAGSARAGLRPYFPAVAALLCGLVRCPKVCTGTRQCAVGCLGWLLGNPRRVCEIFGEYDCDRDEPAVLEPTLEVLAWAASQDAFRSGAVEVLVGIARAILVGIREALANAQACGTGGQGGLQPQASAAAAGPWAAAWAERRRHSSEVRCRASAFNRDPEAWYGGEAAAGAAGAEEVARFLLESRGSLDGSRVGTFLGQHEDVMAAYVRQFDLRGLGIVPAFSKVLRGMQLSGEAQRIDRFCQRFGAAWGEANGIDPEAAYVFAFSLVMLSTDLHRVGGGHDRMTFAQFEKSLLGALPKGLLPEKLVREAYEEIRAGPLLAGRRGGVEEESPLELCERLRRALICRPAPQAQQPLVANLPEGLAGLWRALWSAAWGPMLGAFSAGAHGAGVNEVLRETALRGLQVGCQAAALLEEVDQAQAFSMAMQQLAPAQ